MRYRIASKVLLLMVGLAAAVVPIFSQQGGGTPPPRFEVASIKPAPPVLTRIVIQTLGNRFLAEGFSLKMLVGRAYNLPEVRVLGTQGWMETDRYNIEARAEASNIAPGQMGLMVQGLLEDRFQLKARRETRELPVYDLVVARDGLKMKLSEDQTPPAPMTPADIAAMQAAARGGAPRGEPGAGPRGAPPEGLRGGVRGGPPAGPPPRGMFNRGNGQMMGTAVPVTTIVNTLTQQLGRPVIDKTGLMGLFDIALKWTPGAEQTPGPFGPDPGGAPPSPTDPSGPTIFTALQEQLGLRLESTKGPVEVVVVDSAQKPSEN